MNHQVQSLVLVNNEWVSRTLDVYQIMAEAQQDDTEMRQPPAKTTVNAHAPEYGILSRTVLRSPVLKYILPASIRHKDFNDVVLVSEDSIQLNEIHNYGRLRHVATKSDFSGRILTARVLGDTRETNGSREATNPSYKGQIVSIGSVPAIEKTEHRLPPEVVVLTLSSRTLLFLWAQPHITGEPAFHQKSIKLPAGSSRFDRLGQYLAIDKNNRAMAVGAYEGRFILYKTKPMELWRNQFQSDTDAIPIEDERVVSIEGRILHMEFLSSAIGKDDYHVVLLFIIAHQGLTKITCFDWDCRYDLGTATARTERVAVDLDDQNPFLLVPLGRSSDFLLIFDTHVSAYKDVLSGTPQRTVIPIPDSVVLPLRPGHSTHRPQWVQWGSALRNHDFSKECFYIAREDGRVMYVEYGPAGAVDINDAGEWPYRIDQAFACVNMDSTELSQSYPDVLMAGATENDGLLCKVGAWPAEYSYATPFPAMNQFTYIESMSNWAPLTSLCVTDLPGTRDPYERDRCALFVANGSAPHGNVSELRWGLRAVIDGFCTGMNGCTGLWVINYGTQTIQLEAKHARQHYAHMLVSLPLETLLLRLVRTQPEEDHSDFNGPWDDGLWDVTQLPNGDESVDDGITRHEETISACTLSQRFSLQITRSDAQILALPTLALSDRIHFPSRLLLAASKCDCPFIAIAYKESNVTYLHVLPVLEDGMFEKGHRLRSRFALSADPTCIELLDVSEQTFVFVGTFDSIVSLFRVSSAHEMIQVFRSSLNGMSVQPSRTLCESAVVLRRGDEQTLVCASRDGLLFSLDLPSTQADTSYPSARASHPLETTFATIPTAWNMKRVGSASAQIYSSSTDPANAFVSCGSDFCLIRKPFTKPASVDVESIWFTNIRDPGYVQHSVTATYQLPRDMTGHAEHERNLGGFLFVVSGDQMLYAQLDVGLGQVYSASSLLPHQDTKTLPRKLILGSKPTYAVYLKLPRKMLVATTEAQEICAPPGGYRALHSDLVLLNVHDDHSPKEVEVKPEESSEYGINMIVARYELKNAERVYSIADWAFEDDRGKRYNLVIVGTGVKEGSGKESGRRLIFNLGQRGTRLSLQKESAYPHPVYCVAMFDKRATVSVIGKSLCFDEFDAGAGRWFNRGVKELPSPGIHITVSRMNVYVSTLQHSHLCYEVTRRLEDSKVDIEQLFTDSRERSCTHHLVFRNDDLEHDSSVEDESLVLVTDKRTATVSGLYNCGERSLRNAATTLFEATLPKTIIRLQRGDIRPPWRRFTQSHESSKRVQGILVDDTIGACSDGTIYAISIISKPARDMLRLLQNLLEMKQTFDVANRFTVIRHRSGDIFDILMNPPDDSGKSKVCARDVDPRNKERGSAGLRNNHINGDLLSRYFQEGGSVEFLVSEGVDEDVREVFSGLARDLLPQVDSNPRDVDKAPMKGIQNWLNEVLMPLL